MDVLVLPQDPHCRKHAADQRSQRRAHNAHAKAINQQRVAADVDDIHHQTGQHADAAVALGTEQRCAAVVQPNERVGDGADDEILLRVVHDLVVNAAKHPAQNGAGQRQAQHTHRNRGDSQHAVQLGRAALGALLVAAAHVLAGDHRAAGGQCRQDLDNQNVQAVHQRHAGHSRLAHTGHHQGVSHAHRHA